MTIYFHIYERVIVLLASILCVFALWVVAEIYWPRWARIGLGTVVLLICVSLAFMAGAFLEHIDANLWYGGATYGLVDASVEELERGRHDAVLNALKRLRDNYRVSYESRGKYDVLSKDAIIDMKSTRNDESAPCPPVP